MSDLPAPITRSEQYLAKIAGEEPTLPVPITREERYLAKIAGEDVDIPPAPITRTEQYLAAIVEGGGGGGGGGGGDQAPEKDVNFIDFDGSILYSYTAAEFANLTELPANPEHDGLTAKGWNWSLSDAQTYVASNGYLWIGQEYATDDGSTRIEIELFGERTSPCLTFALDGEATIDWGDNTAPESITGSSSSTAIYTPHTYAHAGKYTIAINVISGTLYIIVPSGTTSVFFSGNGVADQYYRQCVRYIYIGSNVSVNSQYGMAYYGNAGLMLPYDITGSKSYAYRSAAKAPALVIPHTWAYTDNSSSTCFANWTNMRRLSLPNTSGSTAIVQSCFASCSNLESVSLPPVRYIRANAFDYCYTLRKLVIPSSVNEIQGNAFRSSALKEIHFKRSTPPTLSSSSFADLPTDCKIYVPTGKLSAYTSASNYPSSSTYTYVEE